MIKQLQHDPALVIISGFPRSGTTWLGKLFDSHPQTLYRHEPDSVQPLRWLPMIIEDDYSSYTASLRRFVKSIPKFRNPKVSASIPIFTKNFFSPAQLFMVMSSLRLVKICSSTGLSLKVPRFCIPKDHQQYTLVWKTIESTGRLGFFAEALSQKRIIHILRHPGAVISSRIRGERLNKFQGYRAAEDYEVFRIALESSIGQQYNISMNEIRRMSPVERSVWLTIVGMEKATKDLEGRTDCKIVIYEELCKHPLETIHQLYDFCNLDFAPQTHNFLQMSTSNHNMQYYSVYKDPMQTAYKWKDELEIESQKLICEYLESSSISHFWPT